MSNFFYQMRFLVIDATFLTKKVLNYGKGKRHLISLILVYAFMKQLAEKMLKKKNCLPQATHECPQNVSVQPFGRL